eukprot:m.184928 g.184928  ORF g.184928 m.184928 type:complete len:228 (-) comp16677_c3_seq2:489-1172(-)
MHHARFTYIKPYTHSHIHTHTPHTTAKMAKVCVASTNPVKLRAVQTAFTSLFSGDGDAGEAEEQRCADAGSISRALQFEFITVDAPSGVSAQPMGDEETLTGARNRASKAREMMPGCHYYCGLEGGCAFDSQGDMSCFAWIVVQDETGKKEGRAKTGMFFLPPEVAALVKDGMELGHANDRVFAQHNSKQKGGAVGLLTDGVVTRHLYYEQTVILALIPFKMPDLYP